MKIDKMIRSAWHLLLGLMLVFAVASLACGPYQEKDAESNDRAKVEGGLAIMHVDDFTHDFDRISDTCRRFRIKLPDKEDSSVLINIHSVMKTMANNPVVALLEEDQRQRFLDIKDRMGARLAFTRVELPLSYCEELVALKWEVQETLQGQRP